MISAVSPRPWRALAVAGSKRLYLLVSCVLVSLLFGAIQFGLPLEDGLQAARNLVRRHAASGNIAVVAIDDRSLDSLGKWPWPRSHFSRLVERLEADGARRIIFTTDFSVSAGEAEDRLFEESLEAAKGKVTLPVWFNIDPVTGQRDDRLPLARFRDDAGFAAINLRYTHSSTVRDLPYQLRFGQSAYPSLAAVLAGGEQSTGKLFPIDYSIDPRTVPTFSVADVLAGIVDEKQLAGRDVVIATTSPQHGDRYFLPGYGQMPSVYVHVLGAETLLEAPPLFVGWLIPLVIAMVVGAAALCLPNPAHTIGGLIAAMSLFLVAPLGLEYSSIIAQVVPAAFLLASLASSFAWSTFRHSYRVRGTTNPVSGLPNLNALRQAGSEPRPLIAARIHNFAQIVSALPADQEKALVDQIAARLSLGAPGSILYQGDEGIFAWIVDRDGASLTGDQLDALHALFRSPIVVVDRPVDLTVTFGVENGGRRSISNRLGSALVAADEAIDEGLRWKTYDPAKLEDASWKLSLLSQLDAAVEAGDLWIAYQPKVDLATRRIVGAEALVRWTHPVKGPISPMEFIMAAEQSDRIERLTSFVLDSAVGAAAGLARRGIELDLSVNLSARLIGSPMLIPTVTGILEKHRLPPRLLTLEVTETAALATTSRHLEALEQLRELGVQISIDDYGTGLSTLDYLKKIPATEIKIDKSFVQSIGKSRSDRLMVHSTIQLAHSLGHRVVAEGVEDEETLEVLASMDCDIIQGFLVGAPMPLSSLAKRLFVESKQKVAGLS